MIITSYTDVTKSIIKINSRSRGYAIPKENKPEFIKMFKKAKKGRAEWNNLEFELQDEKDYYILTVYYDNSRLLMSYGVKNEAGRKYLRGFIAGSLSRLTNEKTPLVVDILDEENYASYMIISTLRGQYDKASTGALTTLCALLVFTGELK